MLLTNFSGLASFTLLCTFLSGCGTQDPLGRKAISGRVTFDGEPLADGSISLQPIEGGVTSSGALITQGTYSIPRDKGLPPGKYRVVINAIKPGTAPVLAEGAMPGDEEGQPPPQELIPSSWNRKSEHIIEVPPTGKATFTHEIVTRRN